MKYFDTFTGIGGFTLGIERACCAIQHCSQQGGERDGIQPHRDCPNSESRVGVGMSTCIGFSEIDKYATEIYQRHYPTHKNYGDITQINAADLPDFDLFVGGFPCQAFSIAGKRKGFDDTRGTLFFDIARILKAKQPRLLCLENVKGLLSHDNGNTFKTIISTLTELGYDLQWQVLNSKNHGVPQNRERVFIIGHLRGTPRPEVFPLRSTDQPYSRELASTTIDANYWKGIDNHGARTAVIEGAFSKHDQSNPDNTNGWQTHPNDYRIRRLTPTECERLQGFPDGWTAEGTEGVSDTQRYKCLGNAVSVPVVQAIMEKLLTPSYIKK